jgi:hypothetical protein
MQIGSVRAGTARVAPSLVVAVAIAEACFLVALRLGVLRLFIGAAGALALYGFIAKRWRRGIYGLILFLPFAGIPSILLYPAPPIITQIKDLVFVIPTYIGFALWRHTHRGRYRILFPGAPTALICVFALMAAIQLMNPALVNPLVGVIGLKVRLFYIPLFYIGYQLIDSQARLFSLARMMVIIAMVPAIVGLVQAVLVYSGHPDLAYQPYGAAARSVTQNFSRIGVTEEVGHFRVPSTFTFVTQYWTFLFAMMPVSYAMLARATYERHSTRGWYTVALGVIVVAALACGARAAFLLMPALFAISAILEGKWQRVWKPLVAVSAGFVGLAGLMGLSTGRLASYAGEVIGYYASSEGLLSELIQAFSLTWLGQGPGMSTGPARFAFPRDATGTGLVGFEGFYALVVTEYGIVGLMLVVLLFSTILMTGYRRMKALSDPVLRPFASGFLAFLGIMVVYLFKGSFIDYDSLNVYFWLYAGMLMKLPALQQQDVPEATAGGSLAVATVA